MATKTEARGWPVPAHLGCLQMPGAKPGPGSATPATTGGKRALNRLPRSCACIAGWRDAITVLGFQPLPPMFFRTLALGLLLAGAAPGFAAVPPSNPAVEKLADGILLPVGDSWLRLTVCADNTIRVAYAKDHAFSAFRPSLIVVPPPGPTPRTSRRRDSGRPAAARPPASAGRSRPGRRLPLPRTPAW